MELTGIYEAERRRIAALAGTVEGDLTRPVFGCGAEGARLMFIGEAPGATEAEQGRPFVGKAGKQLDGLLAAAGIERDAVFVTNAVKYRPTKNGGRANRTPSTAEIKAALPSLAAELAAAAPRVTATLGNTPLRAMYLMAGARPRTVGEVHGRPLTLTIGGKEYTVFPLYHPAGCIYNRELVDILGEDMIKLGRLMTSAERRNSI